MTNIWYIVYLRALYKMCNIYYKMHIKNLKA